MEREDCAGEARLILRNTLNDEGMKLQIRDIQIIGVWWFKEYYLVEACVPKLKYRKYHVSYDPETETQLVKGL